MDPNRDVKPIAAARILMKHPEIVRLTGFAVDLFGDLS